MKLLKALGASIFCLIVSVVPFLSAKPTNADFLAVEKVALAELEQTKTPGAAIAIIKDDRVIYAQGFGVASLETKTPVTPEMLFRLGSTTKMFTATAALSLAENGKLQFDKPIGNYVKGVNARVGRLTLAQLLSNTAGLRDLERPPISHDDAALGVSIRAWPDDVFFTEPSQIYSYSSAGFWLSGLIVEETSGKPYADAMNELVFAPLGMTKTTLRPLMAITYPFAVGHSANEKGELAIIRPLFDNAGMWPAGSIFSSVNDLSRFVIAVMNGGKLEGKQALPANLVAQLTAPHAPIPGETDSSYCYGMMRFTSRGRRFLGHGGFSAGYGSMIQIAPEQRVAVITVSNSSGQTMSRAIEKAFELMVPLTAKITDKPPTELPLAQTEMAAYVGVYAHEPLRFEVSSKDGKLRLKYQADEHELKKIAPNKFAWGDTGSEFVFVKGASGQIEYLFDGLYSAKKIQPR